jgi:hypothetical protein
MKPDRWMLHKQCTVICLLGFVLFLSKQAYKTECLGAEIDRIPSTIHVTDGSCFSRAVSFISEILCEKQHGGNKL